MKITNLGLDHFDSEDQEVFLTFRDENGFETNRKLADVLAEIQAANTGSEKTKS